MKDILKIDKLLIDFQEALYDGGNCFDCPFEKECDKFYHESTPNIVLCATDHEEFMRAVKESERYGDGSMKRSSSTDILKSRVAMTMETLNNQIANLHRKERDLEYRLKKQEIDYVTAKTIANKIDLELNELQDIIGQLYKNTKIQEDGVFGIEKSLFDDFLITKED